MSDISDFQDDECDSSTSFVSADIPHTSIPLKSAESQHLSPHTLTPLASSFILVDDVTDQLKSVH